MLESVLRRWRMPAAAMLAAAALAGSAAASAQDAGLRATVQSVTELTYPHAQAVINVEDTTGASLASLDASNFTVSVDGAPAPVSQAELASSQAIPLDVLLLIDTSGSTEGEALGRAKSAAIAFVSGLAAEDRVAIMRFANSVTLQQDFTADKDAAIAAIGALESKGQTELYKATDAAIRQAATSTSARRAMILLTDGAGDAIVTGVTESQALDTAYSLGVPVFTIAQGAAILDPAYLQELARVSNGRYLEAPTPGDLDGVYQSIGRLLQNQYVVTFDASSAAGKAESAVTVQVSATGRSATGAGTFKPGPEFVAPSVVVSGLTAGEKLEEPREVTVTTSGPQPITKAAFYVDSVNVFEATGAPFTYTYDPDKFGDSEHTLRVAVTIGDKIVDGAPLTFTSVPSAPPPAATDSGGGGGVPVLPVAGGIGLLALLAAGFLVVQRIKQTSGPSLTIASPDQRVTPWAAQHRALSKAADAPADTSEPAREEIGEPLGILISRAGSDLGKEYAVGGKPVSIGSGSKCALRIADSSLATEEARLWIRKGNLMFHKLSRLTTIAAEGGTGGWVMIEPGDTFTIGSHTFEFRLLPEGAPMPESSDDAWPEPAPSTDPADSPDVPNILRDRPAGPSTAPAPGMASQGPRRLTELMPRDMGFSHQDLEAPEDQASQAS